MREEGLLTALPGNRDPHSGQLRVTAFVTPRIQLTPDESPAALSQCPQFADWTAISGEIRLALVYTNGVDTGRIDLVPDPSSPRPDPALWRTLFAEVTVGADPREDPGGQTPGQFQDLSNQVVASFPSRASSELIRDLYKTVAQENPTAFPLASSPRFDNLREAVGRLGASSAESSAPWELLPFTSPTGNPPLRRHIARDRLAAVTSSVGVEQTLREALRFYDRPGAQDPLGPEVVPPKPGLPRLEFHGLVAALADYPQLLRHLGLALDFLLVTDHLPAYGEIRFEPVEMAVEWARPESARPWTAYEMTERRFLARPRETESDLADGCLRVDSADLFLLEQIDLDGGALKLAGTAATMSSTKQVVDENPGSETTAPSMTVDESSLPALRGTGLTLYHTDRARKIVTGWDAAKALESQRQAGNPPVLFAGDVTRGYRLDVAEQSRPDHWLTLHARTGTYTLRTDTPGERLPLPVPIQPDEGYIKAASTSHNAAEPAVAYLHEAVAGWEGWSLAAPRPGRSIGELAVDKPDPDRENKRFDIPLEVTFRPTKGTLPSLRYGRSYRIRARLVDMAGGSVPEDALSADHVTPFTPFFRWDPVPAPAVVPRRPFTEGESLLRMVIRSTLGVSAAQYARLPRITGLAGHTRPDLAYREVNERHLAAPIGSQQLAELHGLFDSAVHQSSTPADRQAAFLIAERSDNTFLSPHDRGEITDGKNPPRPIEWNGDQPPPLGEGQYVLHDVDQLALPYLPDPLAVGAAFTSLPGTQDPWILDWPTTGAWFDRAPIRFRIEDGTGQPDWDPDTRLLRIFLPPAEHVTVRLSSVLPPEALTLMGIWMLEEPTIRDEQEKTAAGGGHWMLTPWTTLDLVHAVEKPLTAPIINVAEPAVYNSGVHRFAGETFAELTGTIGNHAKSTGRLDIDATWTEPIDDPTTPGPLDRQGSAHVGDFLIGATEDHCRIARHDFAPTPQSPATHQVRHEFGDTKHRLVAYVATATTRFREYFPPEITNSRPDPHADPPTDSPHDPIRHIGPALRLHVPSSQRPDPPQVEYVIPTWTWEERTATGLHDHSPFDLSATRVRKRVGGGLRVYLARPWYSSGADEALGVVLTDQPWLTLPWDRHAGLLASEAEIARTELDATRILDLKLIEASDDPHRTAAQRLLTAASGHHPASREFRIGPDTNAEDAALIAHLAVLHGAHEHIGRVSELASTDVLTAALEQFTATATKPIKVLGKRIIGDADPTTRWGTDPAWSSEATIAGPFIHQFPLRTQVGRKITIHGYAGTYTVVAHQPVFDERRGQWYCDLQLDAGTAYQPFLDLALVRYQPYSTEDCHASTLVRPGFIQLVPDRTAAVTTLPFGGGIAVSLRGPSGYNRLGQDFLFDSPVARLVDLSREVLAEIQTRPIGGDDIDWTPHGQPTRLHPSGDSLADITWNTRLAPPATVDGHEQRLVITEHELFETDRSQAETWIDRPAGGFGEATRKPAAKRLVFATEFTL